jgi:membrane protease YdiL (CAAX protease family)
MARAAGAVVEVVAATALAHVGYKALKLLEPPGRNFAPGLVLLLVAAALLWIHRRERAAYGVFTPAWREGVSLGAVAGAAIFVVWLVVLTGNFPGSSSAPLRSIAGLACVVAAAVAGPHGRRARLGRLRPAVGLLLVAGILVAVACIDVALGSSPGRAASTLAGRVFFTGLGEEVFFRGYAQSRLNLAFGRPVRILGVPCGAGLWIGAALFGAVHFLNPTLYFSGQWDASWTLGAATFGSGLVMGFLREMTSSIWAGVLVHATSGACGAVR